MESIYYVLCWACHRRCDHCYEERFRPYVRDALETVVREAEANAARIVGHLPESMLYRETDVADAGTLMDPKQGRIILAGGEVLLDPVRERVLYPTLERLRARYRDRGGVRLVVQTTGDLVTAPIVADLLRRGMDHLSVSGLDDYHAGMEGGRKDRLREELSGLFTGLGMVPGGAAAGTGTPSFGFFGATPDQWIGKIWPRGRAWANGVSTATLEDNFCNRWSGGLGFLRHGRAGSEVAVDPDGNVYPCCLKTRTPLGSLLEEPLTAILDSLAGHPAFEAISAGRPEHMGLADGWPEERFRAACRTVTPQGTPYANLCVGCDRFHEEVLGPVIQQIAATRRAARGAWAQPHV